MSLTFKSNSDKSNAKRFLTKTAKVANFEEYLTNVDGKWGTWMGEDGVPVPFANVQGNVERGREEAKAADAQPEDTAAVVAHTSQGRTWEEVAADSKPVNATVFGAQALAQLTATPTAAAAAAVVAEAAVGTSGLKIQKNREMRNGVTRYSEGSVGAKLWALFDTVGPTLTLPQARELASKAGLNTTSAGIGLYSWRRFNGYGKAEPVAATSTEQNKG